MAPIQRLPTIVRFYQRRQRMPSLRELQRLWRFRSIHAAEKVAGKLITLGLLAKDRTGRLLPTRYFHAVRV
jgi:DNA-binding transcriptional regulator YbjK